MLRAVLTVTGHAAEAVMPSMGPETGRELSRTVSAISMEDGDAVITVEAADTSAMRAALNSHLECIRVIEDIENLAVMKP